MSNYYLFLDDMRKPSDVTWVKLPENVAWNIVKNYHQFIETIQKNGVPKFISFDHDLADEHYNSFEIDEKLNATIDYDKFKEKTGYDCAKWLGNYCLSNNITIPNYSIHTLNSIGKENIYHYLENCKKHGS